MGTSVEFYDLEPVLNYILWVFRCGILSRLWFCARFTAYSIAYCFALRQVKFQERTAIQAPYLW